MYAKILIKQKNFVYVSFFSFFRRRIWLYFAAMKNKMLPAALAIALALAPRCERIDVIGTADPAVDSLTTIILPSSALPLKCADVFLYSDSGVRRLEGHLRLTGGSDSAKFRVPVGDKLAVVVANSPRTFNDLALLSYDSMEILPFHYCDETPDLRMLSGSTSCRAGDTLRVPLSSFMCSVELRSVEHSFDKYRRLEDPIVYLENASAGAEVLRRDAFLPAETTSDTTGMRGLMWDKLPCDVGMYPQYPGIRLQCYPNESSVNRTRLVVEGKVDGRVCRFSTELPPMRAAGTLSAELKISSKPETYSFSVY